MTGNPKGTFCVSRRKKLRAAASDHILESWHARGDSSYRFPERMICKGGYTSYYVPHRDFRIPPTTTNQNQLV